jgi:hypothetical protein
MQRHLRRTEQASSLQRSYNDHGTRGLKQLSVAAGADPTRRPSLSFGLWTVSRKPSQLHGPGWCTRRGGCSSLLTSRPSQLIGLTVSRPFLGRCLPSTHQAKTSPTTALTTHLPTAVKETTQSQPPGDTLSAVLLLPAYSQCGSKAAAVRSPFGRRGKLLESVLWCRTPDARADGSRRLGATRRVSRMRRISISSILAASCRRVPPIRSVYRPSCTVGRECSLQLPW